MRWLKNSVLGAANDLIKGLATEEEANYDIAIKKLSDKYLCSTHIKQSIFDYIYSWKNLSPDKLYQNVLKNLIALENHLNELLGSYHLDYTTPIMQKYLAHCVLRNIPSIVRNGFFN